MPLKNLSSFVPQYNKLKFFTDKYIKPSLITVVQAISLPIVWAPLRQRKKGLPCTNSLAYFIAAKIKKFEIDNGTKFLVATSRFKRGFRLLQTL